MMSGKKLFAICLTLFLLNLTCLYMFIKYSSVDRYCITIDKARREVALVPDNFLSFGIDSSHIQLFDSLASNERLHALTYALSPATLRVGGTMSERLIFVSEMDKTTPTCENCSDPESNVCRRVQELCKKKFLPFFLLTGEQWTRMCRFATDADLRMMFSFNVLLRDGDAWDDTNARELLAHAKLSGCDRVDWQLGNEPNSFPHTFNVSIAPRQLAVDFQHLRLLLKEYGYEESLVVGPDTTRPQPGRPSCLQYMVEFLGNVSHGIDVRAWHQYYLNSRTARLEEFWDPETLDALKLEVWAMKNRTTGFEGVPMWLSETSSAYGGGAPGLSDSYAAAPLWLDKLGLCALYNITTVVRQSLIGGNYSLIDRQLNPLPDWWISVLYKRLVGNKVLHVDSNSSKFQRFYAHCANTNYTDDNTAITLYGMNLELSKIKFLLNGTAFDNTKMRIEEYMFGAPSNNRKSKVVLLNGLRMYYGAKMPVIKPKILDDGPHIVLPPYSIGFWVIKNTNIQICN